MKEKRDTVKRIINDFFKISERGSLIKKEVIGGLTTFFAMIYILSVNPGILSMAPGAENYTGAIFLGTVLASFIGTFLMGIFANVPLALAPGMGLNAFFTFNVAMGSNLGFSGALMAVFISGLLYFFIAISNLRKHIINAISKNLKITISIVIGLFIGYVGLKNTGIISQHPATLTSLGDLKNPLVIIGIITLSIMVILYFLKVKGAIVISMILGVVMLAITYAIVRNWELNDSEPYKNTVEGLKNAFILREYGEFNRFGEAALSMWQQSANIFANPLFYVAIFTFLYVDFFDTTGMLMIYDNTLSREKFYNEKVKNKWIKNANIIDGFATVSGALLLNSSVTSVVESTTGLKSGARTGFASIITALMFLVSIALFPLLNPFLPIQIGENQFIQPITGPVLILISILITKELKYFDWKKNYDIVTLSVGALIGTLGFSISMGAAFAFSTHVFIYGTIESIKFLKGKKENNISYLNHMKKNVSLTLLILSLLSTIFIIITIYAI